MLDVRCSMFIFSFLPPLPRNNPCPFLGGCLNLKFIHKTPYAWKANPQRFCGAETFLHRLFHILYTRAVISGNNLDPLFFAFPITFIWIVPFLAYRQMFVASSETAVETRFCSILSKPATAASLPAAITAICLSISLVMPIIFSLAERPVSFSISFIFKGSRVQRFRVQRLLFSKLKERSDILS